MVRQLSSLKVQVCKKGHYEKSRNEKIRNRENVDSTAHVKQSTISYTDIKRRHGYALVHRRAVVPWRAVYGQRILPIENVLMF